MNIKIIIFFVIYSFDSIFGEGIDVEKKIRKLRGDLGEDGDCDDEEEESIVRIQWEGNGNFGKRFTVSSEISSAESEVPLPILEPPFHYYSSSINDFEREGPKSARGGLQVNFRGGNYSESGGKLRIYEITTGVSLSGDEGSGLRGKTEEDLRGSQDGNEESRKFGEKKNENFGKWESDTSLKNFDERKNIEKLENEENFDKWKSDENFGKFKSGEKFGKVENEHNFSRWKGDGNFGKVENEENFGKWRNDGNFGKTKNEGNFRKWKNNGNFEKVENEEHSGKWKSDEGFRNNDFVKLENYRKENNKSYFGKWENYDNVENEDAKNNFGKLENEDIRKNNISANIKKVENSSDFGKWESQNDEYHGNNKNFQKVNSGNSGQFYDSESLGKFENHKNLENKENFGKWDGNENLRYDKNIRTDENVGKTEKPFFGNFQNENYFGKWENDNKFVRNRNFGHFQGDGNLRKFENNPDLKVLRIDENPKKFPSSDDYKPFQNFRNFGTGQSLKVLKIDENSRNFQSNEDFKRFQNNKNFGNVQSLKVLKIGENFERFPATENLRKFENSDTLKVLKIDENRKNFHSTGKFHDGVKINGENLENIHNFEKSKIEFQNKNGGWFDSNIQNNNFNNDDFKKINEGDGKFGNFQNSQNFNNFGQDQKLENRNKNDNESNKNDENDQIKLNVWDPNKSAIKSRPTQSLSVIKANQLKAYPTRGNRKYQHHTSESDEITSERRNSWGFSREKYLRKKIAHNNGVNHFRYIDSNNKFGAIPGVPGRDYPINTENKSSTSKKFTCPIRTKTHIYIADRSSRCQVFYVCYANNPAVQMVCPDGTLFNQQLQVCDWWFNVIC